MLNPEEKQRGLEKELRLIQRCVSGEEEAFETLIDLYKNMVFNLSYRFMGDFQEAEDLSQEVFLKVFRSLSKFRMASSLKTWIYRITTNMALNRLKWQQRRKKSRQVSIDQPIKDDLPTMAESLPDAGPGPERKLQSTEIHARLQSALDEISSDQKAVIILRDIEGFSYEEISQTLKINIGTVKSRLARGRANVQERLKDLL